MISLDSKTTALVMIDLQRGLVCSPLTPRSGAEVVECAKALTKKFRAAGAPVIWVRVEFAKDFADAPRQQVDEPMRGLGASPADWAELTDGLAAPGDLAVVKRQ
jgi:nicotinamidase-related amidase